MFFNVFTVVIFGKLGEIWASLGAIWEKMVLEVKKRKRSFCCFF